MSNTSSILAGSILVLSSMAFGSVGMAAGRFGFDESTFRNHPKNLARRHLGAEVAGVRGLSREQAAALVGEDVASGVPVGEGGLEFVVEFDKTRSLRHLSFLPSSGLSGQVAVSVSKGRLGLDDGGWQDVRAEPIDGRARGKGVRVRLGGREGRSIRVRIHADEPGAIFGFGVFGYEGVRDFELVSLIGAGGDFTKDHGVLASDDVNIASTYAGARVVYASAGSGDPNAMIDGDASTRYEFAAGQLPLAVVELGQPFAAEKVAILSSEVPSEVQVYALESFDESSFDGADLDAAKPVGFGTNPDGAPSYSAALATPTAARFLVFRWTPGPKEPIWSAADPLAIHEIGAFVSEEVARQMGVIPGVGLVTRPMGEPSAYRYGPLGYAGPNYLRRTTISGGFVDKVPEEIPGETPEPQPMSPIR